MAARSPSTPTVLSMTEFDPACRRCPRLAAFLDEGRARAPWLPLRAGGAFRRRAAAAAGRGPGAGLPRRQRDGPAVHRRLRRHAALRDAARLRLGEAPGLVVARRRPAAARLPHHERREVRAARQQADARRDRHLQRLPARPNSTGLPRRHRRARARARSPTARCCGRYGLRQHRSASRTAPSTRCRAAGASSIPITAAATTPTRAG